MSKHLEVYKFNLRLEQNLIRFYFHLNFKLLKLVFSENQRVKTTTKIKHKENEKKEILEKNDYHSYL